MKVLGIETTCDETAAAVVARPRDILAQVVYSQISEHAPYGGVVPELAARAHLERLPAIITQVLAQAHCTLTDLNGIAVAGGPGLIGGLIVGMMTAKALAFGCRLPFFVINHLEAHALTARLTDQIAYPYLLLLVSGGHTQLVLVEHFERYHRLGTTLDDAVGEAFDKAAQLMHLGYPGGPLIEKAAMLSKSPQRFNLPRPMLGRANCDFSFSGLKTALRQIIAGFPQSTPSADEITDLCAAFQTAVADTLIDRCRRAMQIVRSQLATDDELSLVIAGGVAANAYLRSRLATLAQQMKYQLIAPPPQLCTDNGAIIAWVALERLEAGQTGDPFSCAPRPRWPLDAQA